MLFTAKCFWPGVTEDELRLAVAGAAGFRGAILLPDDELVLCLFDGPSAAAVREAAERAYLPCERVIASIWLPGVE